MDVLVKRDDLIHPVVSGNKWRKLKYIVEHANELGFTHLISMGGPHSNHLHALAYLGKQMGFRTTGIVRGHHKFLSPTLRDISEWGMDLEFVSRESFRELRTHRNYNAQPGLIRDGYWIPEGGYNPLALHGIADMVAELTEPYDIIVAPCGTGSTLAGMIRAVPVNTQVTGFSALKGDGYIEREVQALLAASGGPPKQGVEWCVTYDYHCGGFAKTKPELEEFVAQFESEFGFQVDPVYTGKMFYGLFDLIESNAFDRGSRIIAVHTGGLQGRRSE